jgi:hypothetical protein
MVVAGADTCSYRLFRGGQFSVQSKARGKIILVLMLVL